MIACLSHTHGLYNDDNVLVWDGIESATRGTKFDPTNALFEKCKDRCAAFLALKKQHAWPAMWDKEVKQCLVSSSTESLLAEHPLPLTLDRFLSQRRAAFVSLQRCPKNVQVELPNEHTRVGYVISNIESSDPTSSYCCWKIGQYSNWLAVRFQENCGSLTSSWPCPEDAEEMPKYWDLCSQQPIAKGTNKGSLKTSKGPNTV